MLSRPAVECKLDALWSGDRSPGRRDGPGNDSSRSYFAGRYATWICAAIPGAEKPKISLVE
jgi:hypothetical protein